jgi:hypothetical protein
MSIVDQHTYRDRRDVPRVDHRGGGDAGTSDDTRAADLLGLFREPRLLSISHQRAHRGAGGQKLGNNLPTDIAGRAGHENPRHEPASPIVYGNIPIYRPSRHPTHLS